MNPLPRLALIADRFTHSAVAERVIVAVRGGVPWVHLRDHQAAEADFQEAARELSQALDQVARDVRVTVNTRISVAEALGIGLHLGHRGPSVKTARAQLGPQAAIGFSAHNLEEGAPAAREGADYLFFSPVFPTSSKPGHPGTGLEALAAFCDEVPGVPVFALGGLAPERVASCREAGAYGVAVHSAILHAEEPDWAVQQFLQLLSGESEA